MSRTATPKPTRRARKPERLTPPISRAAQARARLILDLATTHDSFPTEHEVNTPRRWAKTRDTESLSPRIALASDDDRGWLRLGELTPLGASAREQAPMVAFRRMAIVGLAFVALALGAGLVGAILR